MADISKINVNSTDYNVKDATARNGLSDKMDKANPTGTGSLSLNRKANTTVGTNSVAEGNSTTASGTASHAEGDTTTASGNYSHCEGRLGTASGNYSHSEGGASTASGAYSHAEGDTTTASGSASHSEGNSTTASGDRSHVEGQGTIANHKSQHVFGEFNVADTSTAAATARGTYVEIVGKGTANNARSNARTLDWNGNETLAGDLIFNGSTSLTNKFIYEKTASGSIATFSDGGNNIPMKSCEVAIVAQQASGTPSPSNPLPITGFSSVDLMQNANNMFFMDFLKGSGITLSDGVAIGTASSFYNNFGGASGISQLFGKYKNNTQYVLSWKAYTTASASTMGLIIGIQYTDNTINSVEMPNNTNTYTQFSIVSNASKTIKRIYISFTSGGANTWYLKEFKFEEGSVATAYEAPQVTPISLGQTIYGGTAELVGGNGTITGKKISGQVTSKTDYSNISYGLIQKPNDCVAKGNIQLGGLMCSDYPIDDKSSGWNDASNVGKIFYKASYTDWFIGFPAGTSLADMQTATENNEIKYDLATPTAFAFTGANIPTLSGVNNVYANCGNIDLEYFTEQANPTAEVAKAIHTESNSHRISGSIVGFNDGGNDVPLKSCNVQIVAQQAGTGTPSPTNVRAISGFDSVDVAVSSKNLWANGDVTFTGYNSGSFLVANLPIGTYTISLSVTSNDTHANTCLMLVYYTDGTNYPSLQFERNTRVSKTITTTKIVNRVVLYSSDNYSHGSGDTATWSDIQIEAGSTATAYEAPTITTLPLPETVYGGYGDVTKANSFVKTWKYVADLSSLEWSYSSTYQLFMATISDIPVPVSSNDVNYNVICSAYMTDTGKKYSNRTDKSITGPDHNFSSSHYIIIKDTSYSNATSFKNSLSGVQLIYKLATPTTLSTGSISPKTLSGKNNIYANCGDIDLTYFDSSVDEVAEVVRLYQHKYSTEEHIVGTWIDGKPLYEKTVECGAIPNAESTGGARIIGISETAHNISNLDKIVYINGIGVGNGNYYPLPCNSYPDKDVDVYVESGYILIVTDGINWRGKTTNSYVTLRYTKT